MEHRFDLRVYYEDTDLAGIVYYANYLKFIERGRSEMLRELGVDQGEIKASEGVVFAVRRVEADYLMPAVFDDALCVVTTLLAVTGARIILKQDVTRGGDTLFGAEVTLTALRDNGKPARIPAIIRAALQ